MAVLFILLLTSQAVLSQDCLLDVSPHDSPFIINSTLTFPYYYYSQQVYEFKQEEKFYLGCSKGTFSPYLAEDGDEMVCQNSDQILNTRTGEIVDFDNLRCQPTPATTVLTQYQECENNGTIFEIGVQLADSFLSLINVCFDVNKLVPFYCKYHNSDWDSKLVLRSSNSSAYKEYVCTDTEKDCYFADSGNMFPDINMDDVYNKQNQMLQNLGTTNVNSSLLKLPLTTNNLYFLKYLSRGQHIQSVAAFDYINVVAAWDLGEVLDNWIIELLRSSGLSSAYLYSGSLGVTTLQNDDGEQIEVFLSDGKIPAPKWLWTIRDYDDQVVFFYNHPNFEHGGEEMSEVCSIWEEEKTDIFVCSFEDVIHREMRTFIDNHFN